MEIKFPLRVSVLKLLPLQIVSANNQYYSKFRHQYEYDLYDFVLNIYNSVDISTSTRISSCRNIEPSGCI